MPSPPRHINIQSLARAHTVSAIKTLAAIMAQPTAPAAARVAAAEALLNRGWGKVSNAFNGEDAQIVVVVRRDMDGAALGAPALIDGSATLIDGSAAPAPAPAPPTVRAEPAGGGGRKG